MLIDFFHFGPFFLFWSIKALREFKEEHNVVGGILKAMLAAQLLLSLLEV